MKIKLFISGLFLLLCILSITQINKQSENRIEVLAINQIEAMAGDPEYVVTEPCYASFGYGSAGAYPICRNSSSEIRTCGPLTYIIPGQLDRCFKGFGW